MNQRRFSIIIPAYNEYENLERNIPRLVKRFPRAEILIIENGSDISPDFIYDNVARIHVKSKGLGLALKWGLISAHNNTVIFLPADLSYELGFVDIATYLIEHEYQLVIGSKGVSQGSDIDRPFFRKFISGTYNALWNIRYRLNVKDITGIKAYDRAWILSLLPYCLSDGILFEVQLIREMRKRQMKLVEIPVKVVDHNPSRFDAKEFLKAFG